MPVTRVIPAKFLRAARASLGWSLETVSEKTGLTIHTLSRIESGRGEPAPKNLLLLEKVYTEAGVDFTDDGGLYLNRVPDDPKDKKARRKR